MPWWLPQHTRNKINIGMLYVLGSATLAGSVYLLKKRRDGTFLDLRASARDSLFGTGDEDGGGGRGDGRQYPGSYLDRKAGEAWRKLFPSLGKRKQGGGGGGGGEAGGAAGSTGDGGGEKAATTGAPDDAAMAAAAAAAQTKRRARNKVRKKARNAALQGDERKDVEFMEYARRPWTYFAKAKQGGDDDKKGSSR